MEVTIVGAYGYTGQLICEAFDNSGIRFNVAGRNIHDLEEVKKKFSTVSYCLQLDMIKEDDINILFLKSDIIVNCAGPFNEESSLLLEKAARSGKHYIDITGELGFVKNSFEKHHLNAKESNSIIVHACAFESLIADLVLQTTSPYESVKTFYWFNQRSVSPGTKLTMKLSQYHKPLCISEHKWISFSNEKRFKIILGEEELIAVPYPLPDIAFAKKRTNCKSAHSFLLLDPAEAKYVSNSSNMRGDVMKKLNKLKERKSKGPSPEKRALQRSRIVFEFRFSDGSLSVKTVENIDMYQTTAKAIVLAVKTLLRNNEKPRGVICPATLFTGRESEALEELGVTPIVISYNREAC